MQELPTLADSENYKYACTSLCLLMPADKAYATYRILFFIHRLIDWMIRYLQEIKNQREITL